MGAGVGVGVALGDGTGVAVGGADLMLDTAGSGAWATAAARWARYTARPTEPVPASSAMARKTAGSR